MGLRFLVSLNARGTDRSVGDFLNVRLSGAPIGTREAKEFLVVDVSNAEFTSPKYAGMDLTGINAKLLAMQAAGEPQPVITHPFAVYETPVVMEGHELPARMVQRSLSRINIDTLPDKADVLNKDKVTAPKQTKDVAVVSIAKPKDTKTEAELIETRKQAALAAALK